VNAGASLYALVILVVGWGIVLAAAAVTLERRLGARAVWIGWIIMVVLVAAWSSLRFHRSFPESGSFFGSFYTLSAFVGVPTAALAWATVRTGSAGTNRGRARQVITAFAAFLLAMPLGVCLAAIPDIRRIFG
jgi:hypothetical protein